MLANFSNKNMIHTLLEMKAFVVLCATLMVLMLCWTCAQTIKQWHADWRLAHQDIVLAPLSQHNVPDFSNGVPAAHLFGHAISNIGHVPISNRQLRVTGTVKAEGHPPHAISKAYLSVSNQPSKIYHVGDHLPDGTKVYDITTDMVILENNGQLEKLPLIRDKLVFKTHKRPKTDA